MRYLIPILMVASMSAEEPSNRLEGLFFGMSYHTARHSGYNGINPGLGLGFAHRIAHDDYYREYSKVDFTIVGGSYLDSYNEHAKFLMPGFRVNWGSLESFHGWGGVNLGYFDGSSFHGVGTLYTGGVGWDRYDVVLTGGPGMVACFLKVDLLRW